MSVSCMFASADAVRELRAPRRDFLGWCVLVGKTTGMLSRTDDLSRVGDGHDRGVAVWDEAGCWAAGIEGEILRCAQNDDERQRQGQQQQQRRKARATATTTAKGNGNCSHPSRTARR